VKSITSKLSIIILSLLVSAPSVGWAVLHKAIENDVNKERRHIKNEVPPNKKPEFKLITGVVDKANTETTQILTGACTSGLDEIISKAIGKSCTAFNVEFSAACNAALDGETVGAGMVICSTATGIIKSQCKGVVKKELGTAVTKAAC